MNEHNREKNYFELLAALVLKEFFPEDYSLLKHYDKRDLRNKELVGVEVCRALDPYEAEKNSFWNKNLKMRAVDEVQEELTKFCDNEYDVIKWDVDGVPSIVGMSPPAKWITNNCLISTIKKKIKKIQKGKYASVESLDLYVFSDSFEERGLQEIQSLLSDTNSILRDAGIRYLFLDEYGWLYRCSIMDGEILFINTKSKYNALQVEAMAQACCF